MECLVVVDVQPAYEDSIYFDVGSLIKQMESYDWVVLLFNGKYMGLDSKFDVMEWFLNQGMSEELLSEINFVEKSYGFFRPWMDTGVEEEVIVGVAKRMIKEDIWDSRDIEHGIDNCDSIGLPDPCVIEALIGLGKATVCGGGHEECLKEIELVMDSLDVDYVRDHRFVY